MTVQELIEELNKIEDKSCVVVIDDADTNWYLNIDDIITFKSPKKLIVLSTDYGNVYE